MIVSINRSQERHVTFSPVINILLHLTKMKVKSINRSQRDEFKDLDNDKISNIDL